MRKKPALKKILFILIFSFLTTLFSPHKQTVLAQTCFTEGTGDCSADPFGNQQGNCCDGLICWRTDKSIGRGGQSLGAKCIKQRNETESCEKNPNTNVTQGSCAYGVECKNQVCTKPCMALNAECGRQAFGSTQGNCCNNLICKGGKSNGRTGFDGGKCSAADTEGSECDEMKDSTNSSQGSCASGLGCKKETGNDKSTCQKTCVTETTAGGCGRTATGSSQGNCCDGLVCVGGTGNGRTQITGGKCEKVKKEGDACVIIDNDIKGNCGQGLQCINGKCAKPEPAATTTPTFGPPPPPPCAEVDGQGKCRSIYTGLSKTIATATDPSTFISQIIGILVGLGGGLALLLIMFSGYRLMTSTGKPDATKAAQEQLTAAIVGLLFLLFSFVILQIIGFDLLRIPGFSPS